MDAGVLTFKMKNIVNIVLVVIVVCASSISAQVNMCKHNYCKPYVETCFPWNNPAGYLCCKWSSARGQYINEQVHPLKGKINVNCDPLKCYVCSSSNKKHGNKCGREFGYTKDEATKAGVFVTCDEIGVHNARACGKMISNGYYGEEIVSRYCYNYTSPMKSWYPSGCAEYHTMDTCYCNKEGCNSQEAIRSTFGLIVAAVFATCVLYISY
ncbi:uncharacterized protein LOC125652436 [Ostrea edulis]|uniref:uncharacterized protein LOC125652436 n=1 Tax=Ostrea edulis TaxID=37623 RepID=UPI0024AF7FAA|nr:uncharacterized protein LOC125652436 [Ostrea edulis]